MIQTLSARGFFTRNRDYCRVICDLAVTVSDRIRPSFEAKNERKYETMKENYFAGQYIKIERKLIQLKSALTRSDSEEAMGTLEIVVITGILLTVALLFNSQIKAFSSSLFKSVFNDSKVISNILK